ncbi:hypothetical protein DFH06DRAFT_1487210 [Mycena polygramma]|nr:hypothetical protein DFH06DRAFT_1487210 [Mycena polygramma]
MSSAFLTPVSAAPGMRICGVDIPSDVLGTILASAPDFDTLHAAVRVCSTWQRVFETHPTSVVLAVARNVAGPALPQAMCVLRYPYPEKTPNDWGDDEGGDGHGDSMEVDDPEATEDDSEDEGMKPNPKANKSKGAAVAVYESEEIGQLTPKERMQLQENAATVRALEDIFSLRYKDRTSKSSALSTRESHRFARAVYRTMAFCKARFDLPLNLDDRHRRHGGRGRHHRRDPRRAARAPGRVPHARAAAAPRGGGVPARAHRGGRGRGGG